ncbi:MAG: GrpB family protein [Promethearchaeota archaeon]|jgi:GrpB-like predicted nucleotidyltransferase (UPF0157 family)
MKNNIEKRVDELIKEKIRIVPADSQWKILFKKEKKYLERILPKELICRIEHFGSTAIPNLSAKPIIDMLVEVTNLDECRKRIVPILVSKGYEYLWRPFIGNQPPFYAWFIKRDNEGNRTHHIHMVESHFSLWDALLFRDYLIHFPKEAKKYEDLKFFLVNKYQNNRIKYTSAKTNYIRETTKKAKKYFQK